MTNSQQMAFRTLDSLAGEWSYKAGCTDLVNLSHEFDPGLTFDEQATSPELTQLAKAQARVSELLYNVAQDLTERINPITFVD